MIRPYGCPIPEVLDMTLRETVLEGGSDDRPWLEIYADKIRDIAQNLAHRKRCVGLHLAYGVDDETPAAKEAVRLFFLSLRDHLTAILARGLPGEIADELATDALVRIEGATLMTAVFDESDAMERAIQATIRDATTASR
ncbi:Transcriptional regulator [Neorhizobium galegae bv. orientalis]|nr:Transcriptional regulator [Neorhizobium galegae bv. orientalis]CDZ74011.1 Transcriptional regulator [Neorhizobium galegae bv. orientalis]